MAETAKILNPGKLVLLPDPDAGCSLADSSPADQFAAFKARHPGHFVVSYINCSAAVKAISDVICTSSNAEKIVRRIPENPGDRSHTRSSQIRAEGSYGVLRAHTRKPIEASTYTGE